MTGSRMGHLRDTLAAGYRALGFDAATGGDAVLEALVLARSIEPTSGGSCHERRIRPRRGGR